MSRYTVTDWLELEPVALDVAGVDFTIEPLDLGLDLSGVSFALDEETPAKAPSLPCERF